MGTASKAHRCSELCGRAQDNTFYLFVSKVELAPHPNPVEAQLEGKLPKNEGKGKVLQETNSDPAGG